MFTIIQDTREKQGWVFGSINMCRQTLATGDYTLQEVLDYEEESGIKLLRIERKGTTGELSMNLGKNKKRFLREMDRLAEYRHKHVIMEFTKITLMQFPEGSGIPKRYWFKKGKSGKRVRRLIITGAYMLSVLNKIEEDYGVQIHFADGRDSAIELAIAIFHNVYDELINGIKA